MCNFTPIGATDMAWDCLCFISFFLHMYLYIFVWLFIWLSLHLSIINIHLGIMLEDITSCFYIVEIDKNKCFRGMKLFQIMWMMKSIFKKLIICKYYINIPPHIIERVTILFTIRYHFSNHSYHY